MDHIAKAEITINAPANEVWKALTDPVLVKQYFFGVDLVTDWKVGSSIVYKGEWEGVPFEEKGNVLEVVPEKRLVSNYYSPSSGMPDLPENYQTIRYELIPEGSATRLMVTQSNNRDEEAAKRSEQNWQMVLDGMKKLLEKE